jgi:hypothetical protein
MLFSMDSLKMQIYYFIIRGLVVKASGWPSFDRQFEPYPRAL